MSKDLNGMFDTAAKPIPKAGDEPLPPPSDPNRPRGQIPPAERPKRRSFDVSLLSVSELLNLRSQIDQHLPPMDLKTMNLEEELVRQYQTVKALQTETLEDNWIEANKKASVASTCASALSAIVKMQTELYTAERFKAIESMLIKLLKEQPLEKVEEFLEQYEKIGKGEQV